MFLDRLFLRMIHCALSLGVFLRWCVQRISRPLGLSYRKRTLSRIKLDAKAVKRLPLHVGLVVAENDFSFTDIGNIIVWCMAMGITYISVYDINGEFKRNSTILHDTVLKKKQEIMGHDGKSYDLHICTERGQKHENHSKQIILNIFSLEDGRRALANMAQNVCELVSHRWQKVADIVPSNLDGFLQALYQCPDPDLVLKFGHTDCLLGFLPWQIHQTEILSFPSHRDLDYKSFLGTVVKFGNTERRCGK